MREGWEVKKLGEVCNIIGGGTPSKANNKFYVGDIPWATVRDMQSDFLEETEFKINALAIKGSSTNIIPSSNVIIATRVGLGKVCILKNDTAINQDLKGIIPKQKNILNNYFLFHWFKIKAKDLIKHGTGATVQGVKISFIENLEIPVPPISEQKRIVEILDEVFAAIDKAKANVEKNLQNAKDLFESYLQNVFEKKGEDWEVKRLDEITEVKDGTHDSPQYIKEGIPFVTQKNIRESGFTLEDTKFITEEDHNKFYKRSNVAFGDIIISMIGANRGMACIVDDDKTFSIKNVGLVKKSAAINQSFLLYFLKSPVAKEYVREKSNGGAQEFIGLTALRAFPIICPNRQIQDSIVEYLDILKSNTNQLEIVYQEKLHDLQELKKSILQKAFSGELSDKVQLMKVIQLPEKVASISTTDLQAGITVIALQRHVEKGKEYTFHRVKAEKIVNTAQYILNIELDRNPIKDAAGPNDFKRAIYVESRAKKAGFYNVIQTGNFYTYTLGRQANTLATKTKLCLQEKTEKLNWLIDLMLPMTTEHAEVVATVYAAWNNLLIEGKPVTDESIVYEARENWHQDKLDIERDKFFKAINWMKEKGLVPKGTGKLVLEKAA